MRALLALAFLGGMTLAAGPAAALDCGQLMRDIQSLNQSIANMSSVGAGTATRGSGNQVGTLIYQRDTYQRLYNQACTGGGSSYSGGGGSGGGSYGGGQIGAAIGIGSALLGMYNNHRAEEAARRAQEQEYQRQLQLQRMIDDANAARRRAEEERRLAAERQRQAALAEQKRKAEEAEAIRQHNLELANSMLYAANLKPAHDPAPADMAADFTARGVSACPRGAELTNYCARQPGWWKSDGYTPEGCTQVVGMLTVNTDACYQRDVKEESDFQLRMARTFRKIDRKAKGARTICRAFPDRKDCDLPGFADAAAEGRYSQMCVQLDDAMAETATSLAAHPGEADPERKRLQSLHAQQSALKKSSCADEDGG